MLIIKPVWKRPDGILEATNLLFFDKALPASDYDRSAQLKPVLVRSGTIQGTIIDIMAEFLGPIETADK